MVAVALCLLNSLRMVIFSCFRGLDTVRISKVKGHADEVMVLHGRVREGDRIGNNAADEAAGFGRPRGQSCCH